MKILKKYQFNQNISKSKLLSSTSGVGSIITTRMGSYVLISDVNQWRFIKIANKKVEGFVSSSSDDTANYQLSIDQLSKKGIDVIDDKRFVKFIKEEESLESLLCLVAIPHMSLSQNFNTPNWKNHPIKKILEEEGERSEGLQYDYMVEGTLFPKWFRNRDGELKRLSEWRDLWRELGEKNNGNTSDADFAPPRDATRDPVSQFVRKNAEGRHETYYEYEVLEQLNLVLVCPNGHLSDIPWSKYLKWRTDKQLGRISDAGNQNAEKLLLAQSEPCCSNSRLKWTENKTKSEGYGSIYIECKCGLGSGKSADTPKVSLEGINSIKPRCVGHKPWQLDLKNPGVIPSEECQSSRNTNLSEDMMVTLVTANNVYYANGFSSLFIPISLALDIPLVLSEALMTLEKKYQKRIEKTSISRSDYWSQKLDVEEFLIENGIEPKNEEKFINELESIFLQGTSENSENEDSYEKYRFQEYRCFSTNKEIAESEEHKGISLKDIDLPNSLSNYFEKIQMVDDLKVTSVQFDFSRVRPKERIVRIDNNNHREIIESTRGQKIYSLEDNEVYVLPANEIYGEGVFFNFSEKRIDEWIANDGKNFLDRFSKFITADIDDNSQGASIKRRIRNNGIKHFLIHSFSHMMMREFEFSCGYPTASLKERLYISNNDNSKMSGVLIYTAEGSEGSMGGLISQARGERIREIMIEGLRRSYNCSSDPLCWESEGQGLFELNLSACFSCSLVSETACEEMNLGLDRRVLVDDDYGFFRTLI